MNPFILNFETLKPETGVIQLSPRILESGNFQDSEFAKILKSQIMEKSAHKEEAVEREEPIEKNNQRNALPEESGRDEETSENVDEDKLYDRVVRFSHEMKEKTALQGEKKENSHEKIRTFEVDAVEIIRAQKELKPENEVASKIKANTEGQKENQKAAAEHIKKVFGEFSHEEKRLNEQGKFLENSAERKRAGKTAFSEPKISKAAEKDLNEDLASAKSQKETKALTEKLKKQKTNALDGEKAKAAAVAVVKAAQENNEQPSSRITADIVNTSKAEISAETKGGHAFQFGREGQFFKNDTANKFPSTSQARPVYNFQEQLQSLLDNARVYVKDGKNGFFHVNLYPKSLGSISMNLGLEQGILNGRFLVENADVKETLLQNFSSIKQQLEESGITVGEFHVNIKGEKEKHSEKLQREVLNYKGISSENEEIAVVYEMNTASYHKGSINMVV